MQIRANTCFSLLNLSTHIQSCTRQKVKSSDVTDTHKRQIQTSVSIYLLRKKKNKNIYTLSRKNYIQAAPRTEAQFLILSLFPFYVLIFESVSSAIQKRRSGKKEKLTVVAAIIVVRPGFLRFILDRVRRF